VSIVPANKSPLSRVSLAAGTFFRIHLNLVPLKYGLIINPVLFVNKSE
jgi:hypothetical protein